MLQPTVASQALKNAFKRIDNNQFFSGVECKPSNSAHDDFQYVDCPHDDYQDNVPDDDD